MTNTSDDMTFTPAEFAEQMQEASDTLVGQQMEWFQRLLTGQSRNNGTISDLSEVSASTAVFKTRVQSGGRISIPDAEREALDISEGDLVQTFVLPLSTGDADG